ncbi:YfcC family protein [Bariatricus massiliensis]|mgnify:FL=1|uniref:YfcC family protein n=1 Tax=Bariatricus massiliensis TaxID=1745713 RepID=A0ABS8DIH9_9FIRM|nr:YfcC family protein [Bariatricus massiliensis]MCB7305052.1 YfcC family protein [Bariatricus massiliensis]MCB7375607.1 YfcC family protein [Bariatricus massiliensis]MCB7388196.1 YfcC family protein [Bariatricus massiliensis]MCB7412368.1 YfcC family protein [Bariatricus massiliensis]MCQ5254650.1 YfcC family protein [Bariatricus massiliensis]
MENKKKKLSFPTALTVLFIVLIFAAVLTAVVPAGLYSKLIYNPKSDMFEITTPDGEIEEMEPTQESLDELGVTGNLDKFLDGSISKPVAVPGTYEKVEQQPQGILKILLAPISGVYDTIDIILFIFILGGCIGVLNYMGAFNAGIAVLSKVTKGKEYILIILITVIIAAGGTTFGLAEETIALYPILVPVFLAAGYDVMVCIAAIYMGSSIGTMFPTINPFSVGNASNAAGISLAEGMGIRAVALVLGVAITLIYILRYAKKVKADPTKSICYDQYEHHMKKFGHQGEVPEFTGKMKLSLTVFGISFCVLVWGLVSQGWWFDNMTALFLACAILLAFTSGIGEKNFMDQFIGGAADLMSVALVVGVARGINIILENGMVSDTILEFFSGAIGGMNPIVFIILMMLVFIVLGFFISSSSGLAVLSVPIMAPLADTVGVSRAAIVSAYAYGLGLISFITPTGLVLASLAMVDVTYDKWLKFIMPLMGITAGFSAIMLVIQLFL